MYKKVISGKAYWYLREMGWVRWQAEDDLRAVPGQRGRHRGPAGCPRGRRATRAPLTFTDEGPPQPANPVAPATRSARAQAKASRQHDETGRPYRSFRGLLAHLATLTRNQIHFAGTPAALPMLAEPTSQQREAFDLIGTPIPLTLK